eukprot:765046-Amphidinium_carterae.1
MAAPLRQLEAVLMAIRKSRFFPDASRSGYIKDPDEQSEPTPIEVATPLPEDVVSGPESAPDACREADGSHGGGVD